MRESQIIGLSETWMTDTFKPGPDAVQIIERETCFRGFYSLDRLRLRHLGQGRYDADDVLHGSIEPDPT